MTTIIKSVNCSSLCVSYGSIDSLDSYSIKVYSTFPFIQFFVFICLKVFKKPTVLSCSCRTWYAVDIG